MKKKDLHKLDKNMKHKNISDAEGYTWLDAGSKKLSVKGLAWYYKNKGSFCRLPLKAEKIVRPPVWSLSQAPAGGYIQFKTDATTLAVQARTALKPGMNHMPASGSNGLFLYCGEGDKMRPWSAAIPAIDEDVYDRYFFGDIPKKMREYKLYLPPYSHLLELKLGFNKDAKILKSSPDRIKKPIMIYGTSITQGGCANNPGSDFVSILGR
ncbi:MAG: SGNH/GDSL hydrolase N-terminal domain-containing protein, partial [Planctomycetota bacterium]